MQHNIVLSLILFVALFNSAIFIFAALTFIKKDKKIIYRDDGQPYLIRYRLLGCKWFKIRVHHILLSDYDCLHDHPWGFISIILKGGYWEQINTKQCRNYGPKWYGPGCILRRPATWQHSLEIPTGRTAWTFVIMFKRKREWGFWTRHGFVHWTKYNSNQKCE